MNGVIEACAGLISHGTLHQLLDGQAQVSPADPAVYCPDGNLTYYELSLQSRLLARHVQERNLGAAGSVLPICMPSCSVWAVVTMFAVLRTGAAFAFIDSSSPDAGKQLQSVASTVNASCVVLGPAEYDKPDMRSAAPCAVSVGVQWKPSDDCRNIEEGLKQLSSSNADASNLAWALSESRSASVTIHRHGAVLESILSSRRAEETIREGSGDRESHDSQFGLILWPFVVRHDTLLELFGTITRGGLILMPAEDATSEDIRRLLSHYSRHHSRTYVLFDRLSDALGYPGHIILYDFQRLRGSPHIRDRSRILFSHDVGYGRVLVTSILSNGDRRIMGDNGDVFVVVPDNIELQTSIGAIGKLIMRDNNSLASCLILHRPSQPDPAQYTLPFTDGFFDTGISACVQPDGSVHILHKVDMIEPIVGDEVAQRGPSRRQAAQDEKAFAHLHLEDTQQPDTFVIDRICVLRRLWADVLCLDQREVKPEDKFLDCGGDSLKAARLISLARVEDVELPVLELFTGNLSLQEMATSTTNGELAGASGGSYGSDSDVTSGEENNDQGDNNSSKTLLDRILLPEWIDRSHVEKVVPATGWQAFLAGQSVLEAQHWADCWLINFYGPVSLDRLQTSCASLLENHDILRTVFAVVDGHSWQLVVSASHYPMHFTLHQAQPDVGETTDVVTRRLWDDTKNALPELDRQWVRFMVIRQNMHHHRLLVRLTHAQYDAGSIPAVLEHLRISYQAGSCSLESVPGSVARPQFSSFVAWAGRKGYVQAAEGFWMTMLRGSKLTHLRNPPQDGPSSATTGLDHVINERISSSETELDLKYLRGIMPASVISAAWSAVLMFLTGESDVVFGIVTSGRHNAMPGIDRVVGPCWNMLPIRTEKQGPGQTVLDLLQQVQRNQQATLAHELLPFRHIVEKCTTWSPWTNPCSIINFENVSIPRTGGTRQLLAPDVEIDFAPMPGPVSGPTDLFVAVTPYSRPTHTGISLELRFDNRRISRDYVGAILRLFSKLIVTFTEDPGVIVTDAISHAATNLGDGTDALRTRITRSAEFIRAVLDKIWADVLGCSSPLDGPSRSLPYYNIKGEVIFGAAIAQAIRRKFSVEISTEIVMRNPTLNMLENWLIHKTRLDLEKAS